MTYGGHLPIQLGLEYNLKPGVIHKIVMLWFRHRVTVLEIAWTLDIPDKDVIAVINQEKRNMAEEEDLSSMDKWKNWFANQKNKKEISVPEPKPDGEYFTRYLSWDDYQNRLKYIRTLR